MVINTKGNKAEAIILTEFIKNNSCLTTICWAKDYEFDKMIEKINLNLER